MRGKPAETTNYVDKKNLSLEKQDYVAVNVMLPTKVLVENWIIVRRGEDNWRRYSANKCRTNWSPEFGDSCAGAGIRRCAAGTRNKRSTQIRSNWKSEIEQCKRANNFYA